MTSLYSLLFCLDMRTLSSERKMVTKQKMKFSIKDFFSKCDQIRSPLWIWSHLLKKSLIKNFIFLCSGCICDPVRHLFAKKFFAKNILRILSVKYFCKKVHHLREQECVRRYLAK